MQREPYTGKSPLVLDRLPWSGLHVRVKWGRVITMTIAGIEYKITLGTVWSTDRHYQRSWPIRHIRSGGEQWWESKKYDYKAKTWGPAAVIPAPQISKLAKG